MDKNQAYQKVIDIIAQNELDFRKISLELAKRDPETFLDIVQLSTAPKSSTTKFDPPLEDIAVDIRINNKISATKSIRTKYGFSLKEAKDIVDALSDAYNGRLVTTYLQDPQFKAFQEILAYLE